MRRKWEQKEGKGTGGVNLGHLMGAEKWSTGQNGSKRQKGKPARAVPSKQNGRHIEKKDGTRAEEPKRKKEETSITKTTRNAKKRKGEGTSKQGSWSRAGERGRVERVLKRVGGGAGKQGGTQRPWNLTLPEHLPRTQEGRSKTEE